MKKYAIIDGQNVINVVEYETAPENPPPGFDDNIIAVQVDVVGPGWTYVNEKFIPPPSLNPELTDQEPAVTQVS